MHPRCGGKLFNVHFGSGGAALCLLRKQAATEIQELVPKPYSVLPVCVLKIRLLPPYLECA